VNDNFSDPSEQRFEEAAEASEGQDNRQCAQLKDNGDRCGSWARRGASCCFFHDPNSAPERSAAQRRGGEKNRPAVLPAETPDFPLNNASDTNALLGQLINFVLRGQLDSKIANTVGFLLGLKTRTIDLARVEERLAAVEAIQKEKAHAAINLFDPDKKVEVSRDGE
jgi:hypothetical protein